MRIISQNGNTDVPYENNILWVISDFDNTEMYRIQCMFNSEVFDLGIYNTKERSVEVMEEIRRHYSYIRESEFLGKEDTYFVKSYYQMPKE